MLHIHKKNEKRKPGNYRPISLLSIFNKLLEKLMHKRLYSFLTKYELLNKFQFGFRKNHSTTLALIEIVDKIRKELDDGNSVIGIYLDLTKAFDLVNHDILLYKLNHYGIRGQALKWFKNYLENRQQYTYVNNTYSKPSTLNIGVPQGSVLGPLLFIIYVNDVSATVENTEIRLFADDTNIFIFHKNLNNLYDLATKALSDICKWFEANQLSVNHTKTCFSVFSNKNTKNMQYITCGDKQIYRTPCARYLGLYVDEKLSWKEHIDVVCKKLTKLSYVFRMLGRYISKDQISQLYYAYVYPHIHYALEVYGNCSKTNMNLLQIVQNNLLRALCNVNRRFSSTKMHKDLNILKIQDDFKMAVLIFVYKQQRQMLPGVFSDYYRSVGGRNTRSKSNNDIYIEHARTLKGQKSIKILGAKVWNKLPKHVKESRSISLFKKSLKQNL